MIRSALTASVSALLMLGACNNSVPDGRTSDPVAAARKAVVPTQAGDSYYVAAREAVLARAEREKPGKARNAILFVGDGMGISTLTAARIYAGQMAGVDGESYDLTMDTFPRMALSRTYSHDAQVSDSAATATAMLSGVKTDVRTLGLTSDVAFQNCASVDGATTDSLFELAERVGMATGLVSTARITHATPAAAYAQSPSRDWEDDREVGAAAELGCTDIASQLVDWPEGDGLEIALGGGRRHFMTADMPDKESDGRMGRRGDGRDLILDWDQKSDNHVVVLDQQGFDALDFSQPLKVLGLFNYSHMEYELDRLQDVAGEPSLADLTAAAITRLAQNDDGYILLVEGGRIDHAHHGTNAARALADTVAFDDAIAKAIEMTGDDTLILVTADHSHTMTIAGYPKRNNPILGKVAYPTGEARAGDGKPYTTLGYVNGPAACVGTEAEPCLRDDLSDVDTTAPDFRQQALVPMPSETHAGEDVPIFATGPGSELVGGVMEQNAIFHVLAQSLNLTE